MPRWRTSTHWPSARLVRDHPENAAYQDNLATSHNNLGVLYGTIRRTADAEAEHHQALAILEPLARDHPDVNAYRYDLATVITTWATCIVRPIRQRMRKQRTNKL